MANKIDLTKTEAAQLANADLDYLKANGARALPNSPSASGWSAEAIKKQLYKQPEILFAWLKRLAESQLDLGEKINDYLDDIGSGGEFPLVFDTLANAQAAVSAGEVKAGSIVFVSNGSDIKAYYCGDEGLVSIGGGLVHKSGAETISGKKTFTGGASFTAGNVNFGSSGSDNGKILDVYYTINLRGPVTSNTIIPGNTFSLGSAEHYWGFAYIDDLFLYGVISDGMHEWAFPSKNGTIVLDSDITKSALETTLGAASSSSNGYMSSSDKSHLDALYALLGSESDADSVVDTINEVLSVFNQYPEGVELATVLGGKVGYSDIYDALDSTATNKALSANQGKALNDRLAIIESDYAPQSTTYTKTETDALLATKVNISDIVDNLVSTATNRPLSANQGRILNDSISELKDLLYEVSVSEATYTATSDVFVIPQTIDSNRVLVSPGCVLSKLKGNTASFNQLIRDDGPAPSYQSWTIDNSAGSSALYGTKVFNCVDGYKLTIGHKYLIWFIGSKTITGTGDAKLYVNVANQQSSVFDFRAGYSIATISSVEAPSSNVGLLTKVSAGVSLTIDGYICFTDLTITGDESLTLDQLKAKYNKHYPYNAGTLYHSIVSKIESWGANIWDEETQLGYWDASTGIYVYVTSQLCSKNAIRIIPNASYVVEKPSLNCIIRVLFYDSQGNFLSQMNNVSTFTAPANAYEMQFNIEGGYGATYNNNICFHIGTATIGYKPYVGKLGTINLPSAPITLRGVNASQDEISFVEDGAGTYTAKIVRKMAVVDLGTLNYTYYAPSSSYPYGFFTANIVGKKANSNNLVCPLYSTNTSQAFTHDKNVISTSTNGIYIVDSAYTSASDFESAMSGVYLEYELAEPTEEIIATGLTFEQVSLLFEEGGYMQVENTNSDYTHADTELAFAVKRAD